ncbi:hypothetical protein HDV00_001281 [Rhizophlyctis rosea]|nr:hypothetical protein HDV00_001281 [Rhizophlyctis rosea]
MSTVSSLKLSSKRTSQSLKPTTSKNKTHGMDQDIERLQLTHERQCAAYEEQIRQLTRQKDSLFDENAKKEKELKRLSRERAAVKMPETSTNLSTSQSQRLQRKIEQLESLHAKIQATNTELQSQIESHVTNEMNLLDSQATLLAKMEILTKENSSLTAAKNDLEGTFNNIKLELTQKTEEFSVGKAKWAAEKERLEAENATLNETKCQLEKDRAIEAARSVQSIADIASKNFNLQSQLANLEQRLDQTTLERTDAITSLTSLRRAYDRLQNEAHLSATTQTSQCQAHLHRMAELESKLQRSQAENAALIKKHASFSAALTKLKDQMRQLEEKQQSRSRGEDRQGDWVVVKKGQAGGDVGCGNVPGTSHVVTNTPYYYPAQHGPHPYYAQMMPHPLGPVCQSYPPGPTPTYSPADAFTLAPRPSSAIKITTPQGHAVSLPAAQPQQQPKYSTTATPPASPDAKSTTVVIKNPETGEIIGGVKYEDVLR